VFKDGNDGRGFKLPFNSRKSAPEVSLFFDGAGDVKAGAEAGQKPEGVGFWIRERFKRHDSSATYMFSIWLMIRTPPPSPYSLKCTIRLFVQADRH
jgi:hypothetical protein